MPITVTSAMECCCTSQVKLLLKLCLRHLNHQVIAHGPQPLNFQNFETKLLYVLAIKHLDFTYGFDVFRFEQSSKCGGP